MTSAGRKAGRPTAARLRARGDGRTLIASTALKAFSEYGFHRVSIRDIARDADVSLSTLYHYYPSKQELLYALLRNGIDENRRICGAALGAAGDDPLARFDALVGATIEYLAYHRIESNLMRNELRNLDTELQDKLSLPQEDASAVMTEIITAGMETGIFATPYPDDARRSVFSMCSSITSWYDPDGPVPLEDLIVRYQCLARTLVSYRPPVASQESLDRNS
ncbi:TetR/AcrR family transcriptional regulator [Nocardia sp. NPDC059239]|uniref:TetR/AcrR family transcriptional regulator n=1 Tax=unclassified Nocardia TaxID=2637762 RepID=UPI0036D10C2F